MNYQTPTLTALPLTGLALLDTALWVIGVLALIAAGAALIRLAHTIRTRGHADESTT